jgi:hypothetical protein
MENVMKGTVPLLPAILAIALLPYSAQAQGPQPDGPRARKTRIPVQRGAARGQAVVERGLLSLDSLAPANAQGGRGDHRHLDGRAGLRRDHVAVGDPDLITIPYWSDSFDYQGLAFKYSMVGTDPRRGSRTTVVPTELIPLRFVFADGSVFDASQDLIDGQTAIQGIANSPLFKHYDFVAGGMNVGDTQYGDAFQRANFWDSVSTRSPNYHVLLGAPTVLPTQTIAVPADKGSFFLDSYSGLTVPLVNEAFLEEQWDAITARLNISPRTLPILVWGAVWCERVGAPGEPGIAGEHRAVTTGHNVLTEIGMTYGRGEFGFQDVYVLSHEVLEWIDDPFVNNFAPGWSRPFLAPVDICDSSRVYGADLLEVGDPVEIFSQAMVALPGSAYHVTEGMFIDFFTRFSPSRSVDGQYSFFEIGAPYGLSTGPSLACIGIVEVSERHLDLPGATFTAAQGLNNKDEVVGYYYDQQDALHGFKWKNGLFWAMDYPGSIGTVPSKINESGDIVGYFYDPTGLPHGFVYGNGQWSRIDFPGSTDTVAYGINSDGDIVGSYDDTQLVSHGFRLRNGRFAEIDSPFGQQTVLTDMNDAATYVGFACDDCFNGPQYGFVGRSGRFSQLNMPTAQFTEPISLNNGGMIVGNFFASNELFDSGFFQLYGYLHVANTFADAGFTSNTYIFGNNDRKQFVGQTWDFSRGRWVGYIGELPLARTSR